MASQKENTQNIVANARRFILVIDINVLGCGHAHTIRPNTKSGLRGPADKSKDYPTYGSLASTQLVGTGVAGDGSTSAGVAAAFAFALGLAFGGSLAHKGVTDWLVIGIPSNWCPLIKTKLCG